MPRKKSKPEDWRKERRANEGSIRERNGKVYARIQFIWADGKRHDKGRQAQNREHARDLIKKRCAANWKLAGSTRWLVRA